MSIKNKVFSLIWTIVFILVLVPRADAQAKLPHFFPEGVMQPDTPAKQWEEWMRYRNATINNLANEMATYFIVGDSIVVEKTYFGQKTKVIFDQHVRVGDKIRYTSFGGQYFITQQQFDDLVAFVDKKVNDAVEMDYKFWSEAEKTSVAMAAKAEGKTEEEFRAHLDKVDPLNPGTTFRQLRKIPSAPEKKDFVPTRELHIGLTPEYPSVLGVAWLNSGIVYYTPVAMIRDYLINQPSVLAHEFVHTNKKLQGIPLVWGFDAETMASIPEMLVDGNYMDVWFHGYAADFRELIKVYFRFDYSVANEEIVKFPLMGNLVIDGQKFNEYSAKHEVAKRELRTAIQKITAQFYSTPIWWTALNDKLVDDNSVFRVMMSAFYNPTLLGGEAETMKWLKAHERELMEIAEKAWRETGAASGDDEPMNDRSSTTFLAALKSKYGITDDDIAEFAKLHKISSAREMFTWEPAKLRKAIEEFMVRKTKNNLRKEGR